MRLSRSHRRLLSAVRWFGAGGWAGENREKRGCGNAAPTNRRLVGRGAHRIPLHFPASQKSCRARSSFGSRLAHRGGTRCPDIANGVLRRKRENDGTSSLQLSMIYASSLLFSCDGMITPLSLVSLLARIHNYYRVQ